MADYTFHRMVSERMVWKLGLVLPDEGNEPTEREQS